MSEKISVLFFNAGDFESVEGSAARAYNLLKRMPDINAIWINPPDGNRKKVTREKLSNIELIDVKPSSNSNPLVSLFIREQHFLKEAKKHKCDVAIFYHPWGARLTRMYLQGKGVPVIFDYIDLIHKFRKNNLEQIVLRREVSSAIRQSNAVITTANKLLEDAKTHNKNVYLIPNGVDTAFYSNVTPVEVKHPAVGFIGGFGNWVNYELMTEIAKDRPDLNFYFMGDGPERSKLIELTKCLPNFTVSEGFIAPSLARQYMAAFDICVIPFIENELTDAVCPLKLFEYWSLEKPVILSKPYEFTKLTENKKDAMQASTEQEWISAIDEILKNPKLAKELGKQGAKKAQKYDWEYLASDFEKIIRQVAKK